MATSTTPATVSSVSPPPAAPEGQSATVAGSRPKKPIAAVPADALAKAWSTHWNVRLETVQTELVRVRRATVDYPAGHGKLQLDIQQEGTGTDPAPSMVVCALRDDSLGARNIKLTRTLVDRLVTDCWGPVLAGGEKKQITDWVLAGKGADVRHDFARFTVHRQIVPTSVRLEMISK